MGVETLGMSTAAHVFNHVPKPHPPLPKKVAKLVDDVVHAWETATQPDSFSYRNPEARSLRATQVKLAKELGLSLPELEKAHLSHARLESRQATKSKPSAKNPSAVASRSKSATAAKTERQEAKANYRKIKRAHIKKAQKYGISLNELERKQLKKALRRTRRQAEKVKSAAATEKPKSPSFKLDVQPSPDKLKHRKPKLDIQKPVTDSPRSTREKNKFDDLTKTTEASARPRPSREKTKPSFKLDTPAASSSTRTRYAFTSSHEFSRLPIGTRLPTEMLFGPDAKKLWLIQNSGNTCYRLSLFESIFQHPNAKDVLNSLEIRKAANGFTVRFPEQMNVNFSEQKPTVTVTYEMLNNKYTATSQHIGPAILERAINLHFPTDFERADIGESMDVIKFMVPDHLQPKGHSFNWNPEAMAAQIRAEIGATDEAGVALSPEQYEAGLLDLIRKAKSADPEVRASVPFMTALGGGHIRSPRLDQSTKDEIVLFNPSSKSRFEKVPMWDTFDKKGKVKEKGFVESFRLIGFGRELTDALESLSGALYNSPEAALKGRLISLEKLDKEIKDNPFNLQVCRKARRDRKDYIDSLAKVWGADPQLLHKCKSEAPEQVNLLKRRFRDEGVPFPHYQELRSQQLN